MKRVVRYLLLLFLVVGVTVGVLQPALTQGRVSQVAVLNQTWGRFKIEDIVMCADGKTAWAAAVGPGSLDDLYLFKLEGVDTGNPEVTDTVFFGDEDFFGPGPGAIYGGTGLPAGMGPRGFPGMTLDLGCSYAYIANSFLDNVIKVDLARGIEATATNESGSVHANDGTIVWPEGYEVDHTSVEGFSLIRDDLRTILGPVDVQLNSPAEDRVLVSASQENALYVLDAQTGRQVARIAVGTGPGSIGTVGKSHAFVVQNDGRLACVELATGDVTQIPGLGINPYMIAVRNDGEGAYVSNQGSDSVSVLSGSGCVMRVVAEVAVGDAPRHIALSPDNRFLYVSNSIDNTVSVIDTRSWRVVETIDVTGAGEPAPIGIVAVSNNNRYLYVFWEGGSRGTPGRMQIRVYDVSGLYATP